MIRSLFGMLAAIALLFGAAASAGASPPTALELPTLEDFAALPVIQDMALSPDGQKLAAIQNRGGKSFVTIYDIGSNVYLNVVSVTDLKLRSVVWVNDQYIIFNGSEKVRDKNFRVRDLEVGIVISIKAITGQATRLLIGQDTRGLRVNETWDRVVGPLPGRNAVRMAALAQWGASGWTTARESVGRFATFEVSLESGRGTLAAARGTQHTRAFFQDREGNIVARFDLDDDEDAFVVWRLDQGEWVEIHRKENASQPPFAIHGVTPSGDALAITRFDADGTRILAELDLRSGVIGPARFGGDGLQVMQLVVDFRTSTALGVGYADIEGLRYEFYDDAHNGVFAKIVEQLGDVALIVVNISDDRRRWLVRSEAPARTGAYYLYDVESGTAETVGDIRPAIPPEAVGRLHMMTYRARDGAEIEAIVTIPPSVETPANLPMVVLPHGGPETMDMAGWDWMAQAFANAGYLVLQPNFRGSSGYGAAFTRAGYGEWGTGVAQHDVTDGVQALVASGWADPERVCIAGWSYGGYAALAGAVFTPDVYRCVIAGTGISDVPEMLRDERRRTGRSSWVTAYWQDVLSGPDSETRLQDVSPVRFAEAVTAPVLLLHGDDDVIVPIDQSRQMYNALRREDKAVRFVELEREDHWLSRQPTRTAALEEMVAFVRSHLGEGAEPTVVLE